MKKTIQTNIKNFYNDIINEQLGIDFTFAEHSFDKIGNNSGVHRDLIYFLILLVKEFKRKRIQRMLEFGSGMSTLFFTKIAQLFQLDFQSYEEYPKYLDLTKKLLENFGLTSNQVEQFVSLDKIDYDVDLIFIDSHIGLRQLLLKHKAVAKIPFILVDDVESVGPICSYFMTEFKRPWFYVYNGSGRAHRLLFVNYQEKDHQQFSDFLATLGYWI